jgi:phage-related baseplate assembly protein
MSVSDLSLLSPPDLLEDLSYEVIFQEMMTRLVSLDSSYSALVESDPAYKVLEVAAYFRLIDRQRVNEAALGVMVAYAESADLDQVGARYNTTRLILTPANDSAIPPTAAVYEEDDDYRRRILLALEGISTAGSVGSYQYHALSAHSLVSDVSAIMPSAGVALITVLSRDGDGTASQEVLDAVDAALTPEDIRPLTDQVVVQSADIVNYGGSAVLYIEEGPEVEPVLLAAQKSLDVYTQGQFRLGRNIRKTAIDSALMVSGVQNVVLSGLDDIVISKEQAAYCTGIALTYGGVDE